MDDIIKALPWLLARGWALVALRPVGGPEHLTGPWMAWFVGVDDKPTVGLELVLWWLPPHADLGWFLCREMSEVTRAAVYSPTAPGGRLGDLLEGLDQEVSMAWCPDDDDDR